VPTLAARRRSTAPALRVWKSTRSDRSAHARSPRATTGRVTKGHHENYGGRRVVGHSRVRRAGRPRVARLGTSATARRAPPAGAAGGRRIRSGPAPVGPSARRQRTGETPDASSRSERHPAIVAPLRSRARTRPRVDEIDRLGRSDSHQPASNLAWRTRRGVALVNSLREALSRACALRSKSSVNARARRARRRDERPRRRDRRQPACPTLPGVDDAARRRAARENGRWV